MGNQVDPNQPGYPDQVAVDSVQAAEESVSFDVLVPDTQAANESNLMGIYLLPGDAIALDFPSPAEPLAYVRQAYIEVYQSAWDPSRDPSKAYGEMVERDENPAESLGKVSNSLTLEVRAHSAADVEGANPAFLRVVADGVEYQISGGEDLSILRDIASSILSQAKQAAG